MGFEYISSRRLGTLSLQSGSIRCDVAEDEFSALQGSLSSSGDWISINAEGGLPVKALRAAEIMIQIQEELEILNEIFEKINDSQRNGFSIGNAVNLPIKDNDFRALLGSPSDDLSWHYELPSGEGLAVLSQELFHQIIDLASDHISIYRVVRATYREQSVPEPVMPLCIPETPNNWKGNEIIFKEWHQPQGGYFLEGDILFSVISSGGTLIFEATFPGLLKKQYKTSGYVKAGELLGVALQVNQSTKVKSSTFSAEASHLTNVDRKISHPSTTTGAIDDGSLTASPGSSPQFIPSVALLPYGFPPSESFDKDLIFALNNPDLAFQSFFNDLRVLASGGLNDDVISLPPFDEDIYARLVKETHRYTLTEVADKKDDLAKENARLGTFVGSLLGLLTMNPLAPFMGRNLGRLETNRGKRIADFLPDPHLLFYQDEHSFLSWSRAQVIAPRLRRIIFSRMIKEDGSIYFRLLPALVTQSQRVLPVQVFKVDSRSYFYRPFAAGIDRRQENYDSIKMLRRYSHFHVSAHSFTTDIKLTVSGRDVETSQKMLFRYQDDSLDYYYADFMIPPGFVF